MIKTFLSLLLTFFLFACQVPKVDLFKVNNYKDVQPYSVAVSTIDISDNTIRYTELPHLETRIPVSPAKALSTALSNRFRIAFPGSSNTMRILIHDASLTQELKESDKWYILDNMEYLLTYNLDIIYTHNGIETERQSISGWEKQALPKRNSIADKEQAWQKMINAMLQKVADKIYADMPTDYKR